jgi:electron transfer flavoprotein beta subunit
MKIVVAIKQVPARDSLLSIAASGKWIEEADLSYEINEPDAYALEAGLRLKELHGGEVVALSAGPPRVAQTIREALAKGADRAIHIEIEDPDYRALDSLATARLLAAALRGEAPDLVLTGLQSDDLGYGQTGPILAELLGLPHATLVMRVEMQAGGIRVKRELEGGWFQYVEMPLPALLSIQSGIDQLRYATLMGIKKARTKEIRRVTAADLGVAGPEDAPAPSVTVDRLYLPQRARHALLFDGDPREAAAQLLERLRFEARVI